MKGKKDIFLKCHSFHSDDGVENENLQVQSIDTLIDVNSH